MAEFEGDLTDEQPFIVKADEVDQYGTALPKDGAMDHVPLDTIESLAWKQVPMTIRTSPAKAPPPARPGLRREGTAPPPPLQPPPPAPPLHTLDPGNPTDSLSLPQLKQLVSQFPKLEQTAYAFQYADAQAFPDEIDEWFQYVEQERIMLMSSKEIFEQKWYEYCKALDPDEQQNHNDDDLSWLDASQDLRRQFLSAVLQGFLHTDVLVRIEAAEVIFYVLAGVWGLTAGLTAPQDRLDNTNEDDDKLRFNRVQIQWMRKGADLLVECAGIDRLFEYFQQIVPKNGIPLEDDPAQFGDENDESVHDYAQQREFTILMSSWYLLIEAARQQMDDSGASLIKDAISALEPKFLVFLVDIIASLRWNESSNIPLTRLLVLFWKSLLLIFGGEKALNEAKAILEPKPDPYSADATHPILTASPLDYHLFRQEITSKYPAYNPPPPLVPLELEHKSILPPLPNHPSRFNPTNGPFAGIGPADNNANSIFHQPVHIATPAPSPPPSPIGPGGKAGKKQNYQTNQNFPFLYPPLSDASNEIGGKGSTNLQDSLVSKKWEGSDVPSSIIEAGQLFASRMRMTRAMRQLWKERELSMQHDRGWYDSPKKLPQKRNGNPERLEMNDLEDVGVDTEANDKSETGSICQEKGPESADESDDPKVQARLNVVEDFYHQSLPNMQSLVIVLLKTTLINVQAIAMQNGSPNTAAQETAQQTNIPRNKSNMSLAQMGGASAAEGSVTVEELDNIRLREISHKAISGALVIMLKWFKMSHILKFEYLTQLLLDSSYIPLILKFFAHQNMEDIVAQKNDRDDLSFFHFCHLNSDHPPLSPTSPLAEDDASSPDEAAPPPIQRHRRSPTSDSAPRASSPSTSESNSSDAPNMQPRPSVDELGNPLAPLPTTPIEIFSWRNFFSSINFLRIMQKITRQKAHRCLLLVQYKSSTILRKVLKTPDPLLRLYTLKLFKSQVPYCGRKWRQSNMRVITAIYLHCRPELRDEWLAGMHDSQIEGEVDEALPLEQALRALTHWWHLRCYGDVMGVDDGEDDGDGQEKSGGGMQEDEHDFFQRELDSMGWGLAALGDDVSFGEDAVGRSAGGIPLAPSGETNGSANIGGSGGEQWETGGPLQMEGW